MGVSDTVFLSQTDSVIIENHAGVTRIKYTIDGKDPEKNSILYTKPSAVKKGMIVKARCYSRKGRGSSIVRVVVE